jgi:NAD kinase
LQVVCQGDVQLLLRHRLECTVLRRWSTAEKNGCTPPETHLVLNDVTIHRGPCSDSCHVLWFPAPARFTIERPHSRFHQFLKLSYEH